MPKFKVELVGRNHGAIGIFYPITFEVQVPTYEEAKEEAYNRYEVWTIKNVIPVGGDHVCC